MKSRIFLLIIVLLSTLQISFANNKIDNLFKKTKELPNAEYYTEDFKNPQVKGVVDGVKAIEVVEADIDNATYLALKKEIEEVALTNTPELMPPVINPMKRFSLPVKTMNL